MNKPYEQDIHVIYGHTKQLVIGDRKTYSIIQYEQPVYIQCKRCEKFIDMFHRLDITEKIPPFTKLGLRFHVLEQKPIINHMQNCKPNVFIRAWRKLLENGT